MSDRELSHAERMLQIQAEYEAAERADTLLCSQCGERPSCMVKIGTNDGWCEACLDEAAGSTMNEVVAKLTARLAVANARYDRVVRQRNRAWEKLARVRRLRAKWSRYAVQCANETIPYRPKILWSAAADHLSNALDDEGDRG